MTLQERFFSKVEMDPNGGCWLWSDALNTKGYGCFSVNGVTKSAHRQSWIAFKGPIPKGLHVLHKCDIRSCVNADHLFLGTNQDNVDDKISKGRAPKPLRNEENGKTILTNDQVKEIRRRYAVGVEFYRSLGREFGVSKTHIRRIVQNKVRIQ